MERFADIAGTYTWGDLLPLPGNAKHPVPVGFTGTDGRATTDLDRANWADSTGNVALRLPDGVVGLDVDHYGDKTGADTLAALETALGPLPPTPMSTGRGDPRASGIRFFRYAGGKLAGKAGKDIDVIQRDHRYAVVWPSEVVNDSGERRYRWYAADGSPLELPPYLDELAELPEAWVEHLRGGATGYRGTKAALADAAVFETTMAADERPPCSEVRNTLALWLGRFEALSEGSHHDTMLKALHAVVASCSKGHPGFVYATDELRAAWEGAELGADRESEFDSMLVSAVAKATNDRGGDYVPLAGTNHPCEATKVAPLVTIDPDDDLEEVPIETAAADGFPDTFDPDVLSPYEMANAVVQAASPLYRFANDVQSWFVRNDRTGAWDRSTATPQQLARVLLEELSKRMPRGDANSDSAQEQAQAKRWKLVTGATRGELSKLVVDKAMALGFNLSDVDNDPHVLWAGGRCWDLSESLEGAVECSDYDRLVPHEKSARFAPADTPTPRFDALLEAVFPDPDVQRFFWGTMGVSTTGESGRHLGIIYGPPGRGKTFLLQAMADALGNYSSMLDTDVLGANASEFKMMDFKGTRLGWVDEGPRNNQAGQDRLKAITGGSPIRGAAKGKPSIAFDPSHTLWFTDNREPAVNDEALLSRIKAFYADAPAEGVAAAVKAIVDAPGGRRGWLAAEGPGILHKMIKAAAMYLNDHSVTEPPAVVQETVMQVIRENDTVLRWLEERTDTTSGGFTRSLTLYQDYREYCESIGINRSLIDTESAWGRRLTALGHHAKRDAKGKLRPITIVREGMANIANLPSGGIQAATTNQEQS